MFSKLLGGLLIIQQRIETREGACASFVDSSYSAFIESCYVDGAIEKSNFTSLDGSVMYAIEGFLIAHFQTSRSVRYSFDPSYNGHSHWFTLSDGDAMRSSRAPSNCNIASENACLQVRNAPGMLLKSSKLQDFSTNKPRHYPSNSLPCTPQLHCFHL